MLENVWLDVDPVLMQFGSCPVDVIYTAVLIRKQSASLHCMSLSQSCHHAPESKQLLCASMLDVSFL